MTPTGRDDRSARRRDQPGGAPPRADVGTGASQPAERKQWVAAGDLPRWVAESLARVTPEHRIPEATTHLENAAKAFAAGEHAKALEEAQLAKTLSPREATIRELIALSAYRLHRWDVALRELRTFRRYTGEVIHVPVEMDVLRALDRPDDVEALWTEFQRFDADSETTDETRVVFGSFLLDRGEDRRAWEVTGPKRLGDDPRESEIRVWYVAARAAQRLGDMATARRLYEAVEAADPAFPGLDELESVLSAPD
jgi:tetratricopeptide (TPR) repeat protein